MTNMSSLVNRTLFAAAFVLAAIAVIEKVANMCGYTLLGANYSPSRLLELATVALFFVVALLLRDIRESLRKSA